MLVEQPVERKERASIRPNSRKPGSTWPNLSAVNTRALRKSKNNKSDEQDHSYYRTRTSEITVFWNNK
jgi:hypothetical protein